MALKTEIADLEIIYSLMDTLHMFLQKTTQMLFWLIFSPWLLQKIYLSQSQYTFVYPDKDDEVILQPTTTSPELYNTNF